MPDTQPNCLYCKRTSQQVPLLSVEFKDQPYWICPEHLPIMIHKPHLLASILPGIETSGDEEHPHEH
jgi:hypothetical protein